MAACVYRFGIPFVETAACRRRRKAAADRARDNDGVRPFWTVDSEVKAARQDRKALEALATGQTAGDRAAEQAAAVLAASGPLAQALGAGVAGAAGVAAGVPMLGGLGGLLGGGAPAPAPGLEQLLVPAALVAVVAGVAYVVAS